MSSPLQRPAILLDRDGTIIEDAEYLSDPNGIRLLPGATEGLLQLQEAGLTLAVVSNQSGVARGYFDSEAVHVVNRALDDMLRAANISIAGWYFCPHGPDDDCACRKPRPGLVEQAASQLNIDLARSWVIGDKPSDALLAQAVGARGILVLTGEGKQHAGWAQAHGISICDSLADAAALILVAQSPVSLAQSKA